jgi:hypothetical protein
LPHNDYIIEPFIVAVVGMVLCDEVLWVQLLKENRAMCFHTNPLLLWGHGGFESGRLRMEVHNWYTFYEFLCEILIGDEKFLFDNCQNLKSTLVP